MSSKLGVDTSYGIVIEGASHRAHLVWPTPVMSAARFFDKTGNEVAKHQFSIEPPYYFREDSFDSTSRIRQGRFYKTTGNSGGNWKVNPSPLVSIPYTNIDADGTLNVGSLAEYVSWAITSELGRQEISNVMVQIGEEKAATLWQVIHMEATFTGEQLVTLKARQSFGVLPDVNLSKVPEDFAAVILEKLDALEDEYQRAGVESVVDRAREATTAILSSYLQSEGLDGAKGKDLSDLVKLLTTHSGKNGRRVIACAGEIAARLHSRGKHAEQEGRDVRPLREQDAQLAVQCVGVVLCDLGWADWK